MLQKTKQNNKTITSYLLLSLLLESKTYNWFLNSTSSTIFTHALSSEGHGTSYSLIFKLQEAGNIWLLWRFHKTSNSATWTIYTFIPSLLVILPWHHLGFCLRLSTSTFCPTSYWVICWGLQLDESSNEKLECNLSLIVTNFLLFRATAGAIWATEWGVLRYWNKILDKRVLNDWLHLFFFNKSLIVRTARSACPFDEGQ